MTEGGGASSAVERTPEQLIAEVNALLAAATPGPWETFPGWRTEIHASDAPDRMRPLAEMMSANRSDAALIAAAPSLLAELVAEVRAAHCC